MKTGTIRAALSSVVLVLFLLLFMGFPPISTSSVGKALTSFQFLPAVIKALAGAGTAVVMVMAVFLVTAMFGRIYCAAFCPLGIFQDFLIFLSKKAGRLKYGYRRPHRALWYGVLLLTGISLFAGPMIVIDLLDPYSYFGRISSHLFRPVWQMIQNLMSALAASFDIYLLPPVKISHISLMLTLILYVMFIVIVFLAFYHGRLYCNTICPVGAILGWISRFSVINFAIDANQCTGCGRCTRYCRSGCMEGKEGRIDLSRCVACFECLDVCPESAVVYGPMIQKKDRADIDGEKRRFLFRAVALGMSMPLIGFPLRSALSRGRLDEAPAYATPPGSHSPAEFIANCTACQLCITVCHTHVLQPLMTTGDLRGLFQPRMDFSSGRCDYTCNACSQVCPSGAIIRLPLAKKQRTRIGTVEFIKDKCVVYTQKRDCGACAEVCPTHAVYTVTENNIRYPRLKTDACVGCGACEFVCPVKENPKAIYVKPAAVHESAGPPYFSEPPSDEKTPEPSTKEEFPF